MFSGAPDTGCSEIFEECSPRDSALFKEESNTNLRMESVAQRFVQGNSARDTLGFPWYRRQWRDFFL